MATGDYHLTALAVARGVGMVPPQKQVIVIQTEAETRPAAIASKASTLKATDKSPQTGRAAKRISRAVSFAENLVKSKEREHQGLVFHVDNGSVAQDDALQALTAIAEVSSLPSVCTADQATAACHVYHLCSMLQCALTQSSVCRQYRVQCRLSCILSLFPHVLLCRDWVYWSCHTWSVHCCVC